MSRRKRLYGLIAQPAPPDAPPATMSMADALQIAVKQAEAADPINYAYIHALNAAAVRLDHKHTDALADALDALLTASAGYDSCSNGQQQVYDDAEAAARAALARYRGTTT